ncbi:polysaccharide pyruvyl transferase family protein [Pseudonocardia pini]|uniref:polysaccharide pyruvyl transferase family protein n=1 Tax=Pseudonocardia pini TaxID=2758030 RepID=UPI0015F10478|nr:polysaccharide pyruvyl transferase family protein [Pseudonocardia pini]
MRTRAPRIGFYGLLGSGNLGNDGSLDAMLGHLRERYPTAEFEALTDAPEAARERWGIRATPMHWNRQEYSTAASPVALARKAFGKIVDAVRVPAWVRRQDAVVMAGMGAFEATLPLRPWGTPYTQFLVCASGRLVGTRVALVGVGADDVRSRALRALFVGAARSVTYLSYRDEYSRAAMRRMGLRERGDRVVPDLVHALPAPPAVAGPTGVVGVGVLDFHGDNADRGRAEEVHARYVAAVQQLVDGILDSGHDVRLLVGDRADEAVVRLVRADVAAHRPAELGRVHADPVTSLDGLMRQMVGLDAVVATRFHNVVCALRTARPTVSLGYSAKNEVLMAEVGLGAYCHRAGRFDPREVLDQLADLLATREAVSAEIAHRTAGYRRALDEQFALLDAALFPGPSPAAPRPAAHHAPTG